jgi:hypothetical protein
VARAALKEAATLQEILCVSSWEFSRRIQDSATLRPTSDLR